MKHIFIINPAAGTGESHKIILPIIRRFVKEHGEDFEIHRSLNKQEIGTYVRSRASLGDPVRFYAVGGDGTICDVVNGMMGFDNAELAVIPCGSGNDFVRNFTRKYNFKDLYRQLNGKVEKIDVIQYNDHYSINMLNIGTDCDIADRSSELRKQKKYKGSASYAAAAIELLPKGSTYDFEYIDQNGEHQREEFMLIAVGNGKYCGGGFKSCPTACLTDGLMDVNLIRLCKGPQLVKLLVKYHQGTHLKDKAAEKLATVMQVPEFTLVPHQDVNLCVDGEIEPCPEIHCKVLPGAIKVVVPMGSKIIE